MRITHLTRTAKSAKRKLALTLFSALAVLGVTGVAIFGAPSSKAKFSLSATPTSQTVTAGQQTGYGISVKRDKKFTSPISLSIPATSLPPHTSATFLPNPVQGSGNASSLTIVTGVNGETTPAGTYTLPITATSGTMSQSTSVTLVVLEPVEPNFTLSATPSTETISDDDTVSIALGIERTEFDEPVALSLSPLPNDVTASFSDNPVDGDEATLTFTTSTKPKAGDYTLTLTGTGFDGTDEITRTTPIRLIVEEKKPFQISGGPAENLVPGHPVPLDLTLGNPHNFTLQIDEVAVSVDPRTSIPGCDSAANYETTPLLLPDGALSLPAHASSTLTALGAAEGDLPTVTMRNLPDTNQDACKGATVYLDYTGSASK